MAAITELVLHALEMPLVRPYRRSYKVDTSFFPFVAELRDTDGRIGWGEAIISTGYTNETPEGGWAFLRGMADRILGRPLAEAKSAVVAVAAGNENAATILVTAIEMLEGSPLLHVAAPARVPLLAAVDGADAAALRDSVERAVAGGFGTLKFKVGFDPADDLARVAAVQDAAAGRAGVRLDANRGFTREQGMAFATALDPAGLELFEQPCAMDDWEANAAVAAVSRVPVMLDESIYGMADIERAATIPGVGFVKLKLKKMVGCAALADGLARIGALGLEPVLGDGVAVEPSCWMEACVARTGIRNAGEMNGFLRPHARLFADPLPFEDGAIRLDPGWRPEIDRAALARLTLVREVFGP